VSQGLQYFFQQLLNGLSIGGIYAMIAVGYSMVYSILYMINFAHGDIYVFGTFIAFALWKAGLPIPAVVILACLAGALVGLFVERAVYRPVRFANRIVPMITALGVAMVLRTVSQVIWGADTLPFLQLIPATTISIGSFRVFSQQLLVLGTSLVCMIAFTLIIEKTKLGKATQCIMQDINLSRLMGIPVDTIIPLIYGLGGFMGVVGGILFSSYYNAVSINLGLIGTLKAWAAAMLGGVGSFYSPFVGGLILGVAEAMAGAYLGPAYKDAVGYLIIVLVLLFRPTGLFGKQRIEKV
jgi:branched-chain amino acid transport system permease protein